MRTRSAVAATLGIIGISWAAALGLAYPQGAPALARALADCAAVATFGFAIVPALDDDRHRAELADVSVGPLRAAGAAWLVTEVCRQVLGAAQTTASPVTRLPLRTVAEFSLHTTGGRAGPG